MAVVPSLTIMLSLSIDVNKTDGRHNSFIAHIKQFVFFSVGLSLNQWLAGALGYRMDCLGARFPVLFLLWNLHSTWHTAVLSWIATMSLQNNVHQPTNHFQPWKYLCIKAIYWYISKMLTVVSFNSLLKDPSPHLGIKCLLLFWREGFSESSCSLTDSDKPSLACQPSGLSGAYVGANAPLSLALIYLCG